jgi:BarA-like signal transduction histidine kinase
VQVQLYVHISFDEQQAAEQRMAHRQVELVLCVCLGLHEHQLVEAEVLQQASGEAGS